MIVHLHGLENISYEKRVRKDFFCSRFNFDKRNKLEDESKGLDIDGIRLE